MSIINGRIVSVANALEIVAFRPRNGECIWFFVLKISRGNTSEFDATSNFTYKDALNFKSGQI